MKRAVYWARFGFGLFCLCGGIWFMELSVLQAAERRYFEAITDMGLLIVLCSFGIVFLRGTMEPAGMGVPPEETSHWFPPPPKPDPRMDPMVDIRKGRKG